VLVCQLVGIQVGRRIPRGCGASSGAAFGRAIVVAFWKLIDRGRCAVSPNFEVFTKRMVPMTRQPFVTIQKRGTLSLNKAAQAALGEPEAVELLFDPVERILGLRPVDPKTQHAYPLRSQGGKEIGPYIVAGTAFTKYYNIDTSVSRRWVGVMEDGILTVNVKEEGTVVTSNRNIAR
jgi:hypothetical protein